MANELVARFWAETERRMWAQMMARQCRRALRKGRGFIVFVGVRDE